ncbi:hypothetical protein CMUS01_11969 [Colletotrichum musicola]|uniref:Uncharacterized protein n=1 Tax=Colletotrichum musicola TaxID=2175873 RepID=A0A8H6N2R3_9PEZI|nr:hypothetical protein CMUS01_11969 [Colletotrichum musicola]
MGRGGAMANVMGVVMGPPEERVYLVFSQCISNEGISNELIASRQLSLYLLKERPTTRHARTISIARTC